MATISKIVQTPLIILIKLYQLLISPLLGQRCRFYPTCSSYAIQAIKAHGVLKGSFLISKRLLKCHPLCEGGVDMVPNKSSKK